ncbi:hypothetical protein [Bacteroides caccae]|uniref:hypothetical protein n=1 Tax=Bacteroides caccae TaxID=47678 RepID=UPI00234C4F2D|nr:hypothetical protein [Bacteroides caccae]MDC7130873.1 hypothetical protein [Bacteroides caccae]
MPEYPDKDFLKHIFRIFVRDDQSTDIITYSQSYEYRGRYAYYLLKEEDKYYLVDFADWSKRMPLPIKDCPVDWMN